MVRTDVTVLARSHAPGNGLGAWVRLDEPLSCWDGIDEYGTVIAPGHPQHGVALAHRVVGWPGRPAVPDDASDAVAPGGPNGPDAASDAVTPGDVVTTPSAPSTPTEASTTGTPGGFGTRGFSRRSGAPRRSPSSSWSSSSAAFLAELIRRRRAPAALVLTHYDPTLVAAALTASRIHRTPMPVVSVEVDTFAALDGLVSVSDDTRAGFARLTWRPR